MSTTAIVIIAVAAVIALVLIAGVGGGPRVTHIETRREKDDGDEDA